MLSAFTSIILRAKKTVNRILPKQFVQLLAQRAILCIGQRIAHTEVILLSAISGNRKDGHRRNGDARLFQISK